MFKKSINVADVSCVFFKYWEWGGNEKMAVKWEKLLYNHSGFGNGHPFFSKERNVLAFFSDVYKRTRRSLRSFPFFI